MFNTAQFTHNASTRTLTVEMSDLTLGGKLPAFEPIYPDAADLGFRLVSRRTGRVSIFHIDNIIENDDREVTSWILKPTTETLRLYPALAGYKVEIFND